MCGKEKQDRWFWPKQVGRLRYTCPLPTTKSKGTKWISLGRKKQTAGETWHHNLLFVLVLFFSPLSFLGQLWGGKEGCSWRNNAGWAGLVWAPPGEPSPAQLLWSSKPLVFFMSSTPKAAAGWFMAATLALGTCGLLHVPRCKRVGLNATKAIPKCLTLLQDYHSPNVFNVCAMLWWGHKCETARSNKKLPVLTGNTARASSTSPSGKLESLLLAIHHKWSWRKNSSCLLFLS